MDQAKNVKTSTLNTGMNKDLDPGFLKEGQYLNAINAKLNSQLGDFSQIQNEPSNFACLSLKYDFIGAVKLPGSKYAIFSTDDFNSEVGIFDEDTCEYTSKATSICWGFNRRYPIVGKSKENFDCTISVYWTDGNGPRRFLNLDNIPYTYTTKNDACNTRVYTNTVDCQATLLDPVISYPNVSIELGADGNIKNGVYQATIAYSINGQRVTDFMSVTVPVSVFSHENNGRALDITIDNIDTEFTEYELAIIYTIDGVTSVDSIGFYNTAQTKVVVTGVGNTAPNNKALTIDEIVTPSVHYDSADGVESTSDYLVWFNPTTKPELNYQLQANKIKAKWVGYLKPNDYYKKGGTDLGYLRDEVYAFAIQWLYDTGYWSPAYPIPGRPPEDDELDPINTLDAYENREGSSERPKKWQIYNTAYPTPIEGDDPNIFMEGEMGYWESTDTYPNNTALWGDLACKPVRHHKFPDNSTCFMVTQSEAEGFKEQLIVMGVRFSNIERPKEADGSFVKGIVGYRIVRSDRRGNKSIIGKGLLYNMGKYTDLDGKDTLYPNYPLNDLHADQFLSSTQTSTRGSSEKNFTAISAFQRDKFTFHGPNFSFNNPGLGTELKIEGEMYGDVDGKFETVYKHPRHKLITNFAAGIAVLIGVAEGYIAIKGRTCREDEYNIKTTVIIPTAGYTSRVTHCETALSKVSVIPFVGAITALVGGAIAYGYYFNQGVETALEVIRTFGAYQQYAYQYNCHAFYNKFEASDAGNSRRKLTYAQYLIPGVQYVNNTKVNNFRRESSVYLQTDASLTDPHNPDGTRKTITQFGLCTRDKLNTSTRASSFYGSIKSVRSNQYGQIDSISYLDTGSGVNYIPSNLLTTQTMTSDIIFGGDQYVGRFAIKRKLSYFTQTLFDVPDGSEFNYIKYPNIIYPRFWINTEKYDSEEVRSLQLASTKHNFDCRNSDNSLFIIKGRYFYLSNAGVADFYVESEYNPTNWDWDETINGRHYDTFNYTDLSDLLRSDRLSYDNKYIYDKTYLKPLTEVFVAKQLRDFDPNTGNCFTKLKNRVIYSQPATKEQIKDNWRVYLPNNYLDFSKESGELTTVKSFGRERLIFLFDRSSPYITMGVDQLETEQGIKVTLGDGGLFARNPQRLLYTDYSHGSSQSRWAFINTQYGAFYPSQRAGKVFMFDGERINDISRNGMKWWFEQNLPFKLIQQFPKFQDIDNPLTGVSLVSAFDNTDEVYYLSKVDYRVKDDFIGRAKYDEDLNVIKINSSPVKLGDPRFFEDCSWTISYDPKSQQWISFHDWHPTWTVQSENHFLTFKNRKLWRHNATCTSFCNFYGTDYPFEIEFATSNGQLTSTLSNLEWSMEAYKYYDSCYDPYHLLDYNFDEMVVYNSEQCSGLLKLNLRPKQISSPYPIFGTSKVDVEYSKVEQKYRVNQFWDLTRDRGEFTSKQIQMFNMQGNGYRKTLERRYFDYNKNQFDRKKFRHNYQKVILRRSINNDIKMIFKFNNNKQIASFR